jgi:hypothetical protein
MEKVIVHRYPDKYTLLGSPVRVLELDEACEALASSGFMIDWIREAIRQHLLAGGSFKHFVDLHAIDGSWKGREDGMLSEYRLATRDESITYVDDRAFHQATGKRITKHAQEETLHLRYLDSDVIRELYEHLPKQARTILDVLNESGKSSFSLAGIEIALSDCKERLKTKQDPMRIFNFYKKRLAEEGHLSPDSADDEGEEDADD